MKDILEKLLNKELPNSLNIHEDLSSAAILYWLLKESDDINVSSIEKQFNKLLNLNVSFIEEELEIKYIMEEIAANNTAGVQVSNPDAIPKKKKTVKDLLARRVN